MLIPPPCDKETIKESYVESLKLGNMPLSEIYLNQKISNRKYKKNETRNISQVSVPSNLGNFLFWLVINSKPDNIIEIGTAFGYSGCHLLAGIKHNNKGNLFTYEINSQWAGVAKKNLEKIDQRFNLVVGQFEKEYYHTFDSAKKIDLVFIDAIHTPEFVDKEIRIIKKNMSNNGLILLDDIHFSEEMYAYWKKIAFSNWVCSSIEINNRQGLLEVC